MWDVSAAAVQEGLTWGQISSDWHLLATKRHVLRGPYDCTGVKKVLLGTVEGREES